MLSFTLLRLLDALPSALSRARGYWVHTVWVFILLFFCAAFWWLNWINRNLDSFGFGYFLFLLAAPSLLYTTATALVSTSPDAIPCWREHFDRVRVRFFVGTFVYIAVLVVTSFVTLRIPLEHPIRRGQLMMLALFAAGAATRSRRGPSLVAGVAAALLLGILVLVASGRSSMTLESSHAGGARSCAYIQANARVRISPASCCAQAP